MVETFSGKNNPNPPPLYQNSLPQAAGQEAGSARLAAVASPASCNTGSALQILRLPEVIARVGLKRASIYLHVNKGTFPKPISLGPRAVGWLEHEIDAWLITRMEIRRGHRSGSV